jgi:hypothetical protein
MNPRDHCNTITDYRRKSDEMSNKPDYSALMSCLLGIIANGLIASGVAMNWHNTDKIGGLEFVVLGPIALVLYALGLGFAVRALSLDFGKWRLATIAGAILNSTPLVGLVSLYVVFIICGFWFSIFGE